MESTLRRLHQSSSQWVVVERVSDIEALTFRSNDYSKNDGVTSDWKALLLNKVVVGTGKKMTRDDATLTKAPLGYDSVRIPGPVFLMATLIRRWVRFSQKWSQVDL